MNDAERQLVDLLLDGELPDPERQRLLERLENDPQALGYLARRAALHAGLRESLKRRAVQRLAVASAAGSAETMRAPASAVRARKGNAWLQARTLTAAAAGLVVGLFAASIVWGYAMARGLSPHGRTAQLLRESFEDPGMALGSGFPREAQRWSGDPGQIVGVEGDVKPKHGAHMLRLGLARDKVFGHLHYILDLTRQPLPPGAHRVELTASFRPTAPEWKSHYLLRAAAFSDDAAQIDPRWMDDLWQKMGDRALTHAAQGFSLPSTAGGWQTVSLTAEVPAGSRTLAISLWAGCGVPHYVDDVRLCALIGETSP